jgi:hypothetical protein
MYPHFTNNTQSHNLLSDDIEIVSFNREGTYTLSSFEVTHRNDEGYQYENNTQSHRAASHQDKAEMNDEGLFFLIGFVFCELFGCSYCSLLFI